MNTTQEKTTQLSEEELIRLVSRELPRLILQNPEIRYELIGVMAEVFAKKDELTAVLNELKQMRQEFNQRWLEQGQEFDRRWLEYAQEIKALREEFNAKFETGQNELKLLRQDSEQHWLDFGNELKQLRQDFEQHRLEYAQEIKALREEFNAKFETGQNELKLLRQDSEQRWLDFGNELKQLRQDFEQHRMEYLQEIKALREDFKALRADFTQLRTDVNKALKRFGDTVQGLGARWGLMSEVAFRSGLAAILTDELGFQVEKFHSYDNSGTVFGHPDQVELDVVIRNGLMIAIEIKSSISRGDLATLQRKIAFYEQTTGARVDRKFVISPFVEPGAAELAERLGMEIYTHSSEVEM